MKKRARRAKHAGFDDSDALVLGVMRGIVEPESEGQRIAHIFAVDTRKYGCGRLISHLSELDEVDTRELPAGAVVTPRLYAVAGPTYRIQHLAQRARRRLNAFFGGLQERFPDEVRTHLGHRIAGIGNDVSFETLIDLLCAELVEGDLRLPRMAFVPLTGHSAVLGLYSVEGPEAQVDGEAINAVLEGWLKVESLPGVDRPWTERDVLETICNPIYGYGLVLEPMGDLVEVVDDFVHALADRPDEYTVEILDREFQGLFTRLEASGRFRRRPDAPPLVGKDQWLRVQLVRIQGIRWGEG